ncbi:MAG: hypothetical protein BAJALOKI1v1_130020 [Promethearchaeota archaeon]|nr:MAG: hypothetical protein BAJALOKI1v1_130020 [Candidatus Lokiarchaeota archaeon]
MRKKIISIIILLIALAFFTYGLVFAQYSLINGFYSQMIGAVPDVTLEEILNSLNF